MHFLIVQDSIIIYLSELEQLELPSSTVRIEPGAFRGSSIKKILIPSLVTQNDDYIL